MVPPPVHKPIQPIAPEDRPRFVYHTAHLWQKEASDKSDIFLLKGQNVSVICTDINGISHLLKYLTHLLAGLVFMHKIWPGRRAHWVEYETSITHI